MSKCLTALAAAAVAFSTPALAGTQMEGLPTKAVQYEDLDLATPGGQADLERRISRAAKSVCRTGARDLASLTLEQKCYRFALTSSREKVAQIVNSARRHS